MTVLSGQQTVSTGQSVSGTTIVSGGALWIMSGATATATTIDGGQMGVAGTASGTIVHTGGLGVMGGGSVHDTQVYRGGILEVDYRSFAYNTTVHNGGIEILSNTFFPSGGDAGMQSAGRVLSGGILIVGPYATMEDVTVESGAEIVFESADHRGATLKKGAQVIYGDVRAGTRQTGGLITLFSQTVHSGGVVNGALIKAGGQIVSSGGYVRDETLKQHSTQNVDKGGRAFDITVSTGCVQRVLGSATDTTLEARAAQVTSRGGFVMDTSVGRGAQLTVDSGSTAVNTTISGGTMEVAAGATAHTVTFVTSGGKLVEGGLPSSLQLHGFDETDRLDFQVVDSREAKVSFKENAKGTAGVLTVSDGTHTASVTLFGQYVAAGFHKFGDGVEGGTLVFYKPVEGSGLLAATSTR